MAVSDQLNRLATRAKQLEDTEAAARSKDKAQLQRDVDAAQASAQAQADALRKSAEEHKGQVSAWWDSVQRSWNDHVASVRQNVDEHRDAHDRKSAEKAADRAEDDAAFAIDYAFAAVEEAEYAVLDATLTRMDADALAKS